MFALLTGLIETLSTLLLEQLSLKYFNTTSHSIILDCQNYFKIPDIAVSLQQRKCKFVKKLVTSENCLCQSLRSLAQRELDSLDHSLFNWL